MVAPPLDPLPWYIISKTQIGFYNRLRDNKQYALNIIEIIIKMMGFEIRENIRLHFQVYAIYLH